MFKQRLREIMEVGCCTYPTKTLNLKFGNSEQSLMGDQISISNKRTNIYFVEGNCFKRFGFHPHLSQFTHKLFCHSLPAFKFCGPLLYINSLSSICVGCFCFLLSSCHLKMPCIAPSSIFRYPIY